MKLAFKFIIFLLWVYGGEIQWLSVQFGAYSLDFFFAKAPAVLSNIAFALSVHITAQSQKTFSIAMKILLTTQTPEKIPLSVTPTRRP